MTLLLLTLAGGAGGAPEPTGSARAEEQPRARLGIHVEGGVDVPGTHDGAAGGPGPGFAIPLRIRLGRGADLRASLGGFALVGHDRVEWTEQDVAWFSDEHRALVVAGELVVGPEFGFAPEAAINPYLGVAGGLQLVAGWHRFTGGTASLRDGGTPTALDSVQVVPALGGDVGVRLGAPARVAVEVEAGYTVSFLPEVPLGEVPTALGASRTAFALDRVRLGLGVSFPLF